MSMVVYCLVSSNRSSIVILNFTLGAFSHTATNKFLALVTETKLSCSAEIRKGVHCSVVRSSLLRSQNSATSCKMCHWTPQLLGQSCFQASKPTPTGGCWGWQGGVEAAPVCAQTLKHARNARHRKAGNVRLHLAMSHAMCRVGCVGAKTFIFGF